MSTHTSPQQTTHLPNQYATPISTGHHNSTPSQLASAGSTNSYSDLSGAKSEATSDGSSVTPLKGKNGSIGGSEGKAKPHICHVCNRGFTTGGHLQRHQRIHTGIKAFKCPFPGCETRTSRQDNLQQHYRTHLSPTLRRGSGSAARAAVNAAMEAAGLKSSTTRAPRKSKGSNGGTPSSTTSASASASHGPSPYQTPTSQTSGPTPYAPYMYDPQHGTYTAAYPVPPHNGVAVTQPQSANSSRVPSPVNGHSSTHSSTGGPAPAAHHQQQYFNQFSPAYYPNMPHQAYRYNAAGVPSPYGAAPPPHHGLYSPGLVPEHGHGYSPMQSGFPTHSRESSYGVITPGYGQPNPLANGYPPRTQTTTPLSQTHETDERYRRVQSPRRRSPPDVIAQGVVDPANMARQPGITPAYGAYHGLGGYGYAPAPGAGINHRASVSSLSDAGSGNGNSENAQPKRVAAHH